jgi:hypothetical protein
VQLRRNPLERLVLEKEMKGIERSFTVSRASFGARARPKSVLKTRTLSAAGAVIERSGFAPKKRRIRNRSLSTDFAGYGRRAHPSLNEEERAMSTVRPASFAAPSQERIPASGL